MILISISLELSIGGVSVFMSFIIFLICLLSLNKRVREFYGDFRCEMLKLFIIGFFLKKGFVK